MHRSRGPWVGWGSPEDGDTQFLPPGTEGPQLEPAGGSGSSALGPGARHARDMNVTEATSPSRRRPPGRLGFPSAPLLAMCSLPLVKVVSARDPYLRSLPPLISQYPEEAKPETGKTP